MPIRSRDDRGARCSLPWRDMLLGGRTYTAMIASDVNRGWLRFAEHSLNCFLAVLAGIVGLLGAAAVWIAAGALLPDFDPPILLFFALWGSSFLIPLAWVFCTLESRRHIRVVKHFGRCPSCAYPFAGLAAAADGCTVCPECGAAWRLQP